MYRGILQYAYYDHNVCASEILSFIFFGQIWSQNLDFSKLTEIWFRENLLCAYYDFKVRFFKILVCHLLMGKFGLKTWCYPNWLESSICIHYQYYILFIIESSNILKFSCPKYYGWVSSYLVFCKLTEFHCIYMLNFSKYGEK